MPRLPIEIWPLKQHRGERIESIAETDPDYLLAVLENISFEDNLLKSITTALEDAGVEIP